jgi:hypothetical protein
MMGVAAEGDDGDNPPGLIGSFELARMMGSTTRTGLHLRVQTVGPLWLMDGASIIRGPGFLHIGVDDDFLLSAPRGPLVRSRQLTRLRRRCSERVWKVALSQQIWKPSRRGRTVQTGARHAKSSSHDAIGHVKSL